MCILVLRQNPWLTTGLASLWFGTSELNRDVFEFVRLQGFWGCSVWYAWQFLKVLRSLYHLLLFYSHNRQNSAKDVSVVLGHYSPSLLTFSKVVSLNFSSEDVLVTLLIYISTQNASVCSYTIGECTCPFVKDQVNALKCALRIQSDIKTSLAKIDLHFYLAIFKLHKYGVQLGTEV